MRIKLKDLELATEHMKKNFCEIVGFDIGSDERGQMTVSFEFTDVDKKLAKIVVFEASVGATPDLIAKRKLYKP